MPNSYYILDYSEKLRGAKAIAHKTDGMNPQLQTLPTDGTRDVYFVNNSEYYVLTGYYYYGRDDGKVVWMQTTYGTWYVVYNGGQDWTFIDKAVNIRKYGVSDAQRIINGIINNNITILQNNLVCARFVNMFTPEQKKLIRDLQKRLIVRNNALIEDGYCENITQNYPQGYADLEPYLNALMQNESIGLATWATIVIIASVIAAAAGAAYFVYRDFFEESEKDVKFSKELMKVLEQKLTPEEYQQLLNETQNIVTKARIRQAAGSYWDILKYAAIAAAGYLGYRFIIKKKQQ